MERKVAHVMNHGMRKSRCVGREKTITQLAYKAAGINLKRIFQCTKEDVSKIGKVIISVLIYADFTTGS